MSDELVLTAIHEAGHALAAVRTGCQLGRVTIVPAPGHSGLCVFRAPWRTPERGPREALLRHLAGPAAEAILLGLNAAALAEAEALLDGGATDFAAARRACAPGSAWRVAREVEDGWRRALAVLERRWTTVQRFAELLAAEGTVPGWRVREVVLGG